MVQSRQLLPPRKPVSDDQWTLYLEPYICKRNFPSQYKNHFRGLSGHYAGSFNAIVFISILSGGRGGVSIDSLAAANTSLLASTVWRAANNSARARCTCCGVGGSILGQRAMRYLINFAN